jgi:murein endopeptidase
MLLWSGVMAFAAEFGPALEGEWVAVDEAPAADTASFGCSDQYLQDGVTLPDLPLFYSRAQPDGEYGTQEMIDLLVEAGRHMSWLMPGASPFVVGDISRKGGGYLAGHITHRGGIDADVGIYKKGAWQAKRSFTTLAPSELDVEATWALIQTFLDSGRIDFILLDRAHIARLRAYTLQAGLLTPEEADRVLPADGRGAWSDVGVLRHAPHHQDHMHVRVLCGDGTRAGTY